MPSVIKHVIEKVTHPHRSRSTSPAAGDHSHGHERKQSVKRSPSHEDRRRKSEEERNKAREKEARLKKELELKQQRLKLLQDAYVRSPNSSRFYFYFFSSSIYTYLYQKSQLQFTNGYIRSITTLHRPAFSNTTQQTQTMASFHITARIAHQILHPSFLALSQRIV
jgi:hypothetical protein